MWHIFVTNNLSSAEVHNCIKTFIINIVLANQLLCVLPYATWEYLLAVEGMSRANMLLQVSYVLVW